MKFASGEVTCSNITAARSSSAVKPVTGSCVDKVCHTSTACDIFAVSPSGIGIPALAARSRPASTRPRQSPPAEGGIIDNKSRTEELSAAVRDGICGSGWPLTAS